MAKINTSILNYQHIIDKMKNLPRYEFSEHSKYDLLQFIKKATKSVKFCDLDAYNYFKDILPMNKDLEKELSNQHEIIDLTLSDTENRYESEENKELFPESVVYEIEYNSNFDQTTVDDVIYAIKENLESQKHVPILVVNNLQTPNLDLDHLYSILSSKLNHEEVINLGSSLCSATITNDSVISGYIKYLLMKEVNNEFSDQTLNIMNDFTTKFMDISNEELSQYLLQLEESLPKTFTQFLSGLSIEFKIKLFRSFAFDCKNLKECHLGPIDILLSPDVDYDSLSKLVDLLSNAVSTYSSNKTFGKLLINVIKCLGKNLIVLEQPLKHIISSHKSIWSSKILKTFNDGIQENMSLTQSFRY